ncbi:MAG: CHASE domain-containing protein [Myxococcales bacterium]|nr:CHASE domain-containing protein [Myxococcales bacterium]
MTEAPTERTAPLARRAPGLIVLAAGLAVSTAAFWMARERARADWQADFERKARDLSAALVNGLDVPLEALQSLPALFGSSEEVTRSEFRAFVTPTLKRHPAIYALEWLPEVPGAERAKWEARARAEGVADFQFTEVGPSLAMVPAKPRPRHVPIFYMEPSEPKALGFDIASDPIRLDPYDRAKSSGRAVASGRIRLVEDAPGVHSIAVFQPVHRTRAGGALEYLGAGVEVFRLRPVVERALRDYDTAKYALTLYDQDSAPAEERVLYEKAGPAARARASFQKSFAFADRSWTLDVSTADPGSAGRSFVLLVGALLSVLGAVVAQGAQTIARLRRRVATVEQLGQYTLESKLGEGGMGVVYRASHAMLRRPTALKLLRKEHGHSAGLARFEREVQLTSQLTHPNTIAVYDYGRTPDGVLYYAMEYIDGIDFEHLVRAEGPLPPGRVVFLMRQVLGSLAEAHSVGLIHRDIKPANLMLCERGGLSDFVKVLDFGLAKQLRDPSAVAETHANAVIGTPHYLAPESIDSTGAQGPSADIYAAGAVMYFLLTGHTVFEAKTLLEVCAHHLHTPPQPPSARLGRPLPAGLETVVLACLSKDPAQRPSSAAALVGLLDELGDVERWTRRDASRWWEARGRELITSREAEQKERAERARERTVEIDVVSRTLGESEPMPTSVPVSRRRS